MSDFEAFSGSGLSFPTGGGDPEPQGCNPDCMVGCAVTACIAGCITTPICQISFCIGPNNCTFFDCLSDCIIVLARCI